MERAKKRKNVCFIKLINFIVLSKKTIIKIHLKDNN